MPRDLYKKIVIKFKYADPSLHPAALAFSKDYNTPDQPQIDPPVPFTHKRTDDPTFPDLLRIILECELVVTDACNGRDLRTDKIILYSRFVFLNARLSVVSPFRTEQYQGAFESLLRNYSWDARLFSEVTRHGQYRGTEILRVRCKDPVPMAGVIQGAV